ncbi:MAG: hypothetical protein JWQ09_66 [Segetibacter sp.]|nr:hypothetical protein [Segetibacter sp.]
MKELIINVPEDAIEFVEQFVESIGGTIEKSKSKKKLNSRGKVTKAKPLDFFGTWPDIPLDPETYRGKLWRKIPEL